MKRYGCLYSCLSSRAIHNESTNSLPTDAFIQALQRFVSRRGNVWVTRTDNNTNSVGASAELNKTFSEMNYNKINKFMLEHDGQCIQWKRNPPTASNMGGVWECQITPAHSIFVATTKNIWNLSEWWITPKISCWSSSYCQYKTHHVGILIRCS